MGCASAKPKIKRVGVPKVLKDAHDEGGPVGPFVPDGDLAAMYTENIAQLRRQAAEQGLGVVTEDDEIDAHSEASTEICPASRTDPTAGYADREDHAPGSVTERSRGRARTDYGNPKTGPAPKPAVTPLRSMSGLSSSSPAGAAGTLAAAATTHAAAAMCRAAVCICRPLLDEPSLGTGMFGDVYLADMTVTAGLLVPSAQKLHDERVLAALLTAAAAHTAPEAVAEVGPACEAEGNAQGTTGAGAVSSLESKSVNSWTMSADLTAAGGAGGDNNNNNTIMMSTSNAGDSKSRRKRPTRQQEPQARKGKGSHDLLTDRIALVNDGSETTAAATPRPPTTHRQQSASTLDNNNKNMNSPLSRTPQCPSLVRASPEWRQWRYLIAMTEFTLPGMDYDVLSTTRAKLLSSAEQQQLGWLEAVRDTVRQWCRLSSSCPHVLRCVQMEALTRNEDIHTTPCTNNGGKGTTMTTTMMMGNVAQGVVVRGSPTMNTSAAQAPAQPAGAQAVNEAAPSSNAMDRHSSQLLRGSVRVTLRSELRFADAAAAAAVTTTTTRAGQEKTSAVHSKSNSRTILTTPTTGASGSANHAHNAESKHASGSTTPAVTDYAACRTTKLRIYFELGKYGTLHTFRKEMMARFNKSYLHELTARALMREVLLGLYQVHEQGLLQYDLHAADIFLVRPMQTVYKTLFPAYLADLPAGSLMKVQPNRMRHMLCQLDPPPPPPPPRAASRQGGLGSHDPRRRTLASTTPATTGAAGANTNTNTNNNNTASNGNMNATGGTSTALAAAAAGCGGATNNNNNNNEDEAAVNARGSNVQRSRSVIAVASPETILGERSMDGLADSPGHHHHHHHFSSPVMSNMAWTTQDGANGASSAAYDGNTNHHTTTGGEGGGGNELGANVSTTSAFEAGSASGSPAGTAMRLDVFIGDEENEAFRLNAHAWRYFTEHSYLEDSLLLPSPANNNNNNVMNAQEASAEAEEERRSSGWFASAMSGNGGGGMSNNSSGSRRRTRPASNLIAPPLLTMNAPSNTVAEVSLSAALPADTPVHRTEDEAHDGEEEEGSAQVARYGGVAQVMLQRSLPATIITTNNANNANNNSNSNNLYAESSISTYGTTTTTAAMSPGYGEGNQASLQLSSTPAFPLLPSRSGTGLPTITTNSAAATSMMATTTAGAVGNATCHRHTMNPLPLLLAPRAKLADFIVVPSVAEATGGSSERRALSASPPASANRFASKDARPSLRTRRPVVKLNGMIRLHRLLSQLSTHGPTNHGHNNSNSGNGHANHFMVSVMRAEEVPIHRFVRVAHAAPEVLQRRRFSEASDVYAFAMTFLELVSPDGEVLPECQPTNLPFDRPTTRREWQEYDAQHAQNLQRWYSGAIEQALAQRSARAGLPSGRSPGNGPESNRNNTNGGAGGHETHANGHYGSDAMSRVQDDLVVVPIPAHLSDECKRMLRACLQVNPNHRPSVAELLACKYFLLGHWIEDVGEEGASAGVTLPEAPWGGEVDFVAAARAMGLPVMEHPGRTHSATMPSASLLHHS